MIDVAPVHTINEHVVYNLITSLRGENTQSFISNELGYSFNQVNKWESGTKKITVEEFVDYCECLNTDLGKLFYEVYNIEFNCVPHILVNTLIDAYYYRNRPEALQEALGFSKNRYIELVTGKRKMFLTDFFIILNTVAGRIEVLLEKLLNKNTSYTHHIRSISLIKKHPQVLMISTCLNLPEYINSISKDSIEVLLKKTGLELEELKDYLNLMKDTGAWSLSKGKYRETLSDSQKTMTMTGFEKQASTKVFKYLLDSANSKTIEGNEVQATFLVAPVSTNGLLEIERLTNEYSEKVATVLSNDNSEENKGSLTELCRFISFVDSSYEAEAIKNIH